MPGLAFLQRGVNYRRCEVVYNLLACSGPPVMELPSWK